MNSIDSRRQRVERLYDLRRQVDAEIATVEAEIEREIRAMRRARAAARLAEVTVPRRPTATCGTDGGYYRHRRTLREDACDACKLAHRVAEAERRKRREEAA